MEPENSCVEKLGYIDQYELRVELGAGHHAKYSFSYFRVYLGVDEQGRHVAIKKYNADKATIETLEGELKVMEKLHHPNLVNLLDVKRSAFFKHSNETVEKCFAIILQYVRGGELFDFIADTGQFSEVVSRTYFHQMMQGVYYMHGQGIAHRDLKPENILISEKFELKIADFGFSCLLSGKDKSKILHTKLGTPGYMAPEIQGKNYEGKSVDVFAAGVILFIMYAGSPPFGNATPSDSYYKLIIQQRYDVFWNAHSRRRPANFFSEEFKDLINKMIESDPKKRITIVDIASHPWTTKNICSAAEILSEFTKRQAKLDVIIDLRRKEKAIEEKKKEKTNAQYGSDNRAVGDVDKQYQDIYSKEITLQRNLPIFESQSPNEIAANGELPSLVAGLKRYLTKQILPIVEVESSQQQDGTQQLECTGIKEEAPNTITASYSYSYEVDEDIFKTDVSLKIEVGLNKKNETVFRFVNTEGDYFFFKKLFTDVKRNYFAQ